jgi:uncharacterized protein (DUF427 family)
MRTVQPVRVNPGPGQESVWDYPRPPRVERSLRRVRIVLGGVTIADTADAVRVLETSHPPAWYVPFAALTGVAVQPEPRGTVCEFKGRAAYWTLTAGGVTAREAGWSYPQPLTGYEALADRLTVYPERVDACYVDDERVVPQPGGFYGGWITDDVVGPFKGGPGSWGW